MFSCLSLVLCEEGPRTVALNQSLGPGGPAFFFLSVCADRCPQFGPCKLKLQSLLAHSVSDDVNTPKAFERRKTVHCIFCFPLESRRHKEAAQARAVEVLNTAAVTRCESLCAQALIQKGAKMPERLRNFTANCSSSIRAPWQGKVCSQLLDLIEEGLHTPGGSGSGSAGAADAKGKKEKKEKDGKEKKEKDGTKESKKEKKAESKDKKAAR